VVIAFQITELWASLYRAWDRRGGRKEFCTCARKDEERKKEKKRKPSHFSALGV
jgi:hypothetical protein